MSDEAIPSIRRFNRAVTQRLGVFTDRFLGRDRPLAEARMLFEIGRNGIDVRDLRTVLELDSGYVSRLLRSLERQDLIEVARGADDRRVRRACLTEAGEAELAELNGRADEFAKALLAPLNKSQRVRIVDAMDVVERLLRLSFTTIHVEDPASADAQWCVHEYYAELDARFPEGFDAEATISAEPHETTRPHGVFVVARLDGRPVGCGALKTAGPGVGSIKRMWVAKAMRGLGLGSRILNVLETQAKELGFSVLRLETNDTLREAQALYRREGYVEVSAFNDEPFADHWFEKRL